MSKPVYKNTQLGRAVKEVQSIRLEPNDIDFLKDNFSGSIQLAIDVFLKVFRNQKNAEEYDKIKKEIIEKRGARHGQYRRYRQRRIEKERNNVK